MTSLKLVETLTTVVLLVVAAALAWLVAASFAPAVANWASTEIAVIFILLLLTAALVLVSVVALLHARSRDLP